MSDSFYRAFEDRYRGSRALIKSRLLAYLPFIRPLAALHQPVAAIDLGCGRGEWLELLTENGFDAYGVDLDEGMLAACRELGLNAQNMDALAALRALPANSVALVSSFHVVEHMPFEDAQALVREALRVLQPGGLLILETPNPENLVVGASSFYLDPSHERPVPPQLLSFVVEHTGFVRTKILRLQESAELRDASRIRLLNVLNGVSPDYGVVGQKSASADILARFDEPFNGSYGLTLETLTQRFDWQSENDFANVNEQLARVETHTASRISAFEERLTQAEERAAQAAAHLHAVLESRSWRITAPLRFAGHSYRRLASAIREDRLVSGIKWRVRPLVLRAGHAVLRRPRLTQAALRVLDLFPPLKQRLRNLLVGGGAASAGMHRSGELSPRAARVYTALKKAVHETRKN